MMTHRTIDDIGRQRAFLVAAVLVLAFGCSYSHGQHTLNVDAVATSSSTVAVTVVAPSSAVSAAPDVAEARAIYSPMLDYNNVWTPIGHGDPLKMDPTFDYSPPVLDRVRYWADTSGAAAAAPADNPPPQGYQANQIGQYNSPANPHSNVVHKTKSDILLLGVPATKRAQFKSVDVPMSPVQPSRRNYYAQLPTVLMPPPMQMQHVTNQQRQAAPFNGQHHSSTPIAGHHYMQWMHAPNPTDSQTQESGHYVSVSLPDAVSSSSNSMATTPSPHLNSISQSNRKKPWIQALLQKEVTRPTYSVPSTSTSMQHMQQQQQHTTTSVVSMLPSSSVYESHTLNFVPSAPATLTAQPVVATMTTIKQARPHYSPLMYTQPPIMATSTYSHPLSNHIIETISPMTWPETTTHFTPTVRPYMRPSSQSQYVSSSVGAGMTTDSMFSHYKQPQQPVVGPAYLIIEGHSKVKTYGNSPAGRHEPNMRPVQSTVDPVVVTVVPPEVQRSAAYRLQLEDEERRFEVRHLHYRQQPTPEQRADELQMARARTTPTMPAMTTQPTEAETTVTSAMLSDEPVSSTDVTTADDVPITTTTRAPTRMSGLLSLLDTSFGDFFTGNAADDDENEMTTMATSTEQTVLTTQVSNISGIIKEGE